jgi:integration host factor subunit alpha
MSTETDGRKTVTKAQIIDQVHDELQKTNEEITKRESARLVEYIFDTIKTELRSLRDELSEEAEQFESDSAKKPERRLKISGFGNFVVRYKRSCPGRNPQNGETIKISSRYVLTFKPSAILKKAINEGA